MTGPELVIVPAHPRAGDACQVELEVRAQGEDRPVLPVFSSVAALVQALGGSTGGIIVVVSDISFPSYFDDSVLNRSA